MEKEEKQLIINHIIDQKETLYRLAYMYTKNEQDALDVVQESIYKALVAADTLKDIKIFKTWMCRIIINTAIDVLRKKKKVIFLEEYDLDIGTGRYDHYENIDLRKALSNLDPEERIIIVLRYFEDTKIQDIAEILDLNINTVKTRLYKILKKLKIDME